MAIKRFDVKKLSLPLHPTVKQVAWVSTVRGFTLVELLITMAILGVLSVTTMAAINPAKLLGKARDAQRVSGMAQIISLLEQFRALQSVYPEETAPFGAGGWETSDASADTSQFMEYLVQQGMAKMVPVDPINKRVSGFDFFVNEGSYFYAFYHYSAAQAAYYGCGFGTDFVVIGFRRAESSDPGTLPRATCGDVSGDCPHGGIPYTCRDWGMELEYSVLLK